MMQQCRVCGKLAESAQDQFIPPDFCYDCYWKLYKGSYEVETRANKEEVGIGGLSKTLGFTLHKIKPGTNKKALCGSVKRLRWFEASYIATTKCRKCWKHH